MVATQRIHIGMIHARKTVTVTSVDHGFPIGIGRETIAVVPPTTTSDIHRYKASKASG